MNVFEVSRNELWLRNDGEWPCTKSKHELYDGGQSTIANQILKSIKSIRIKYV